jgi:hypothetical protein
MRAAMLAFEWVPYYMHRETSMAYGNRVVGRSVVGPSVAGLSVVGESVVGVSVVGLRTHRHHLMLQMTMPKYT